jgi:2-dehydropantoate 2-reductase
MGRVRYIIIGAGAVGGTIGGCLFQAGHEVVLVARGAHLDALRGDGLRLATPFGTEVLPIPAVGGAAEVELRHDDVLILATKTQDSAALLAEWAWQPVAASPDGAFAADVVPVVCAQNGVVSERYALRRFRHVYGMYVWLPATHLEPGTVEAQGAPLAGLLQIGRYPAGTDPMAGRIGEDLTKSRFFAPVTADVMRWKYGKLLDNLNNAIEALCGRDRTGFASAPQSDDAAELYHRTRAEGTAALHAAGIAHVSRAEVAKLRGDRLRVEQINGSPRSGGSSWQSLTRGTGTIEADFLNGEIVLLGRVYGVPTPVNEALQRLANRAAADHRTPGLMTPAEVLAAAGVPRE